MYLGSLSSHSEGTSEDASVYTSKSNVPAHHKESSKPSAKTESGCEEHTDVLPEQAGYVLKHLKSTVTLQIFAVSLMRTCLGSALLQVRQHCDAFEPCTWLAVLNNSYNAVLLCHA